MQWNRQTIKEVSDGPPVPTKSRSNTLARNARGKHQEFHGCPRRVFFPENGVQTFVTTLSHLLIALPPVIQLPDQSV